MPTFTVANVVVRGKALSVGQVLVDSGASSCLMDERFARAHHIQLVMKAQPVKVELADGRSISSGVRTWPLNIVPKGLEPTMIP